MIQTMWTAYQSVSDQRGDIYRRTCSEGYLKGFVSILQYVTCMVVDSSNRLWVRQRFYIIPSSALQVCIAPNSVLLRTLHIVIINGQWRFPTVRVHKLSLPTPLVKAYLHIPDQAAKRPRDKAGGLREQTSDLAAPLPPSSVRSVAFFLETSAEAYNCRLPV